MGKNLHAGILSTLSVLFAWALPPWRMIHLLLTHLRVFRSTEKVGGCQQYAKLFAVPTDTYSISRSILNMQATSDIMRPHFLFVAQYSRNPGGFFPSLASVNYRWMTFKPLGTWCGVVGAPSRWRKNDSQKKCLMLCILATVASPSKMFRTCFVDSSRVAQYLELLAFYWRHNPNGLRSINCDGLCKGCQATN